MALKKNSPYKEFFAKEIQKMQCNGVWHLYKQRNSKLKIDCNAPTEEGHPFDFLKTGSIFMILFFGAILSILFSFYEHIMPQAHKNTTYCKLCLRKF